MENPNRPGRVHPTEELARNISSRCNTDFLRRFGIETINFAS